MLNTEGARQSWRDQPVQVSAQVRPSKSTGKGACCVRRRNAEHEGTQRLVRCVIEPRTDELAGRRLCLWSKRNMCNAVMRALPSPGSKSTSRAKGSRRNWDYFHVWRRLSVRSRVRRSASGSEERKPMMHGRGSRTRP